MKIVLFTSGLSVGGGKNAIFQVAKGLKEKGHDVSILIIGDKVGYWKDKFMNQGIGISSVGLLNVPQLYRFIKWHRVDIILVDAFWPNLMLSASRLFVRVKVIRRFGAVEGKRFQDFFYRLLLYRSNVIVPAEYLRRYLNSFIIKPKEITVVENYVYAPNLDIKKESATVFTASRLIPRKRIERVIELARLNPEYLFKIAGEGKLLTSLKREATKLNNVQFLGELSHAEVMENMAISEFYYLPSHGEGYSFSIIEALKLGCHVVCHTDIGGSLDYIENLSTVSVYQQNETCIRLSEIERKNIAYTFPAKSEMIDGYYKVLKLK